MIAGGKSSALIHPSQPCRPMHKHQHHHQHQHHHHNLETWFQNILYVHPYLGKIPMLIHSDGLKPPTGNKVIYIQKLHIEPLRFDSRDGLGTPGLKKPGSVEPNPWNRCRINWWHCKTQEQNHLIIIITKHHKQDIYNYLISYKNHQHHITPWSAYIPCKLMVGRWNVL